MLCKPTFEPVSWTNARVGPDGCGQIVPSHPQYHADGVREYSWFNTTHIVEFEGSSSEDNLKNNAKKLLWSAERMMNDDCRRRFVYGLTFEGTSTRIWFFCRQIIFASRAFDLMKEPDHLIQIISTLAYANPTELGFDPTMELIHKDGSWNYRITVTGVDCDGNHESQMYETTRMLSGRYNKLRGRATRIYEAYSVDDDDKQSVVIKDVWADVKRPLEGDTLSEILKDATAEERSYFLTILQHGVVNISGQPDHTRNLLLGGYDLTLEHHFPDPGPRTSWHKGALCNRHYFYLREKHTIIEDRDPFMYAADLLEVHFGDYSALRRSIEHDPRVHYRLVFREKGASLHTICQNKDAKVSLIATAMQDIIQALNIMWKKRYVHRDVSPGNIIIYNGRARLSDLEFAIIYGTALRDDIRMGTYHFMAVEINDRRYIMNPHIPVHNPLHDLESVWWIGVWSLFCHYSPHASLADPEILKHIKYLQLVKHHLFTSCSENHARTRLEQAMADGQFAHLSSPLFSKPLQCFYLSLEQMRAELYGRMSTLEAKFPIDISFFERPGFFTTISNLFEQVTCQDTDENLWPLDLILKQQHAN